MKKVFVAIAMLLMAVLVQGQKSSWLTAQALLELDALYSGSLGVEYDQETDERQYLEGYAAFLAFIADENQDRLLDLEQAINKIEQSALVSKSKNRMMRINLGVQKGLMELMCGRDIDGIYNIYKAYKLFKGLSQDDCNTLEYEKLEALFTIFSAQVEQQSTFVSWLFGMEGDVANGFLRLEHYLQSVKGVDGLETEANVLYAYSVLKFDAHPTQRWTALIDASEGSDAPLLAFVTAMNGIKNGKSEEVIKFLSTVPETWSEDFPLLHYARGRALLNRADEEGCKALQEFIDLFSGSSYICDAYYRMARYRHVTLQAEMRDAGLAALNRTKCTSTSEDRQAQSEAGLLAMKPQSLCLARFLYDGGYYEKAWQVLHDGPVTAYRYFYQIEHYYRLGRVGEGIGAVNKALEAYDRVIMMAVDDERYFGPYAALYAAKIYIGRGQKEVARQYLQKARQLNNGEYKKDVERELRHLTDLCI